MGAPVGAFVFRGVILREAVLIIRLFLFVVTFRIPVRVSGVGKLSCVGQVLDSQQGHKGIGSQVRGESSG